MDIVSDHLYEMPGQPKQKLIPKPIGMFLNIFNEPGQAVE
jgi:hypothetical protein